MSKDPEFYERRDWIKENGWKYDVPKPRVKRKLFNDQQFALIRPEIRREA